MFDTPPKTLELRSTRRGARIGVGGGEGVSCLEDALGSRSHVIWSDWVRQLRFRIGAVLASMLDTFSKARRCRVTFVLATSLLMTGPGSSEDTQAPTKIEVSVR